MRRRFKILSRPNTREAPIRCVAAKYNLFPRHQLSHYGQNDPAEGVLRGLGFGQRSELFRSGFLDLAVTKQHPTARLFGVSGIPE